jgi:hypothetical protein
MSNILKGLINEADSRNFDSDIDYYNALNRKPKPRSEPQDKYDGPSDEDLYYQKKADQQKEYAKKVSVDYKDTEGTTKDGERYNGVMIITAPSQSEIDNEIYKFKDLHWGAKKIVGNPKYIQAKMMGGPMSAHVAYVDNHKHGMWKPFKDEPPVSEPISFGESKAKKGSMITETRTYKLWENAGQKIAEAQLTQDQINQIFGYVEKIQTAGGDNRTMLGKGKDAASAVNKAWEDLKTKVQDSGPIKGVDAMYDKAAEQLKQATGGDQGVMQYVQKYRDFAKKHPVAQSLIYSALIAAAGISGAGLGGAAALGLFKMVDKLLQGEKFSSATYQGAKTGAMAYGASKLADYVKGKPEGGAGGGGSGGGEVPPDIQQGLAADQAFQDSMLKKFPTTDGYTYSSSGDSLQVFDSTGRRVFMGDVPLKTMDMKTFADLTNNGQMATPGITSGSISSDPMAGVSNAGSSATNTVSGTLSGVTGDQIVSNPVYQQVYNDQIRKFGSSAMSIQGAKKVATAAAKAAILKGQANESINLSESQLYLVIGKIVERQRKLDEGIMDTIKGAAGKAVDWAKTKGTNLTTKVTADKLLQAWKKAGSPTDSLDVAKVVQDAGVASDTIKQVYGNMKIPFAGEKGAGPDTARKIDVDPSSVAPPPAASSTPAQPTTSTASPPASTPSASTAPAATSAEEQKVQTTYAQVRALIDKLDKRGKQNVVKTLKKNLGIALTEDQINELSTDLLANYKKKASADATAADKKGDYKRGDKRFSGIVKATKKQFANDTKGVTEGKYDSGDYYNARQGREYGAKSSQVDSGAYEFEKEVHRNEPGGEQGRPKNLKGVSKSLPADAFGRTTGKIPAGKTGRIHSMMNDVDEDLDENLHKWFKEKWVRFGPDGKIRGDCARGDDSEGKPKCLPQSKAQNLGKKGRASAAARKRREDPNPERSGKAINVNTKKKSNEGVAEGSDGWIGNPAKWKEAVLQAHGPDVVFKNYSHPGQPGKRSVNAINAAGKQVGVYQRHNKMGMVQPNMQGVAEGSEQRWRVTVGNKSGTLSHTKVFTGTKEQAIKQAVRRFATTRNPVVHAELADQGVAEEQLDEKCWDTHKQVGMKNKGGKQVPNCVPKESIEESRESCPECGGPMFSDMLLAEKQDACYNKVKSRYKVWPSAYASGALVQCRKKGADNWGNGGKKNEGVEEGAGFDKWADDRAASQLHKLKPGMVQDRKTGKWYDPNKEFEKKMNSPEVMDQMKRMAQKESIEEDQLDEKWTKKYKDSINCSNPKGFSQKAHCAGKQKNESSIMQGLNQLDEGWKEKLGAAALAGSLALGAGAAHSRVTPDGEGGVTGGLKPTATVTAPSDNKPAAEAPRGFSKDYLQKAANPDRIGRYMISVEKAQELLKSMP